MYQQILQTIGNTPLVLINKIIQKKGVKVFAKLEGFNPSGSIKDRIALKMIEQAINNGELTKGKTIIEATSGNTGISLAMIGVLKGYKVEIVMSAAVSIERRMMIEAYGATVTTTPPELGTDGAIKYVQEITALYPEKYFCTNQFSNKYNKIAHYKTTSEEIWQQTNGCLTHLVSAVGTSGTIMGVGLGLKENNPHIKIVEAQPTKGHYIQGLKNMEEAIVPSIYNSDLIDLHIMIDTEEAFSMTRQIVKEEGIFVGMSSGAALLAAKKLSEQIDTGVVVVIFPDRGEKYLSTGLFKTGQTNS